MRALLRAGGEIEGSAMNQQLAWLVSQYVQVALSTDAMPPHARVLNCSSGSIAAVNQYVVLMRQCSPTDGAVLPLCR